MLDLCEEIFDRCVQVTQEVIPVELRLTITDVHKAFCAEALRMEAQEKDNGLKNRVSRRALRLFLHPVLNFACQLLQGLNKLYAPTAGVTASEDKFGREAMIRWLKVKGAVSEKVRRNKFYPKLMLKK